MKRKLSKKCDMGSEIEGFIESLRKLPPSLQRQFLDISRGLTGALDVVKCRNCNDDCEFCGMNKDDIIKIIDNAVLEAFNQDVTN